MAGAIGTVLGCRTRDEATSAPVPGTATATVVAGTASGTPEARSTAEPELRVGQVIGMRGCEQPIFVTAGGMPPRTGVRLDRVDDGQAVVLTTSDGGFASLDGRELFARSCKVGVQYSLRLVDASSERELASGSFEAPVLPGTIEVEPAAGGCEEIVVTLRGMPVNSEVSVFMAAQIDPFAHNFASVVWPLLQSDGDGIARSAPFLPPWRCETSAVSLFASAGGSHTPPSRQAELLYRVALGAGEPVPEVERWLESMGR